MSSGSFTRHESGDGSPERNGGIQIEILGESRPFSKYGQSICYYVTVNGHTFFIDCGAPIFEHLSRDQIEDVDGLFATHSHEDHKRWFTDLAIYLNYLTEGEKRLNLMTIDPIQEEFLKNSRGALERTLSADSRDVVEVPYRNFVNPVSIGPSARYRIVRDHHDGGTYDWRVVDEDGRTVSPDRAKVVILDPEQANRPRMLFRDPETSKWVEPTRYYSFASDVFYHRNEAEDHITLDDSPDTDKGPVRISPVKDPVWHGPPTIGIDIQAPGERVIFSSDTVYDPELWESLAHEDREMNTGDLTDEEFASSSVIYGDINNFIERSWSVERYERALSYYRNAVVVHDCGPHGDPVHTDYRHVRNLDCKELLLTHCPDRFISEVPIAIASKKFTIRNNRLKEDVDGNLYELRGDIYVRDSNRSYVGFKNPEGRFQVIRQPNGTLEIGERPIDQEGEPVMTVDLYRDIQGKYYPYLHDENQEYQIRPDQRVERVHYTESGSEGVRVEHLRAEDGGLQTQKQSADPSI